MYVIAIGWLYVTLLMALTERSVVAGVLTFLFYGLAPVALLVFLTGGPGRRRRLHRLAHERANDDDRGDAKPDQ